MFHDPHEKSMAGRKGIRSKLCSKCNKEKELGTKRYCRECAASHMREWRKTHPMTEFQKFKANTRSKTKVYVKRGLIKKLPCEICNSLDVQAHHEDYHDAYNIHWLCASCHREHHIEQSYDQWKWKQLKMIL
jgi:hypothetical protein